MKFPDLETHLAGVDLELLGALRQHAVAAGKTNADADDAFHSIRLVIESLEYRILRESKIYGQVDYINRDIEEQLEDLFRRYFAAQKLLSARPTNYIARLVRIAAYRQGKLGESRLTKQEATRRATEEDFLLDEGNREVIKNSSLRPAETRAIEIIQGSKVKANKNPIEKAAIELANEVLADFSRKSKSGRPAGRRDNIVFDAENFEHDLKLTVIEVVKAVLPFIEQLAPNSSSKPDSLMIAAVVKAVRSAGLKCEPELATDTVQRLRHPKGPRANS